MEIEGIDIVLAAVIGIVTTFITPLFTSPKMNSHWKNVISVAVAFAISAGYVAFTGGWDWADLGGTLVTAYAISQIVYQQLLKNISKSIEERTSGGVTEDDYLDYEEQSDVEFAGDEAEEENIGT